MGILRILRLKRGFERISRLAPREVEKIQTENIHSMLNHASACSAFYKQLYGRKSALELLKDGFSSVPTVDKKSIMEQYDSVVTHAGLKRELLERHIAEAPPGRPYRGEYKVIHTSGSSGTVGIFVYDRLAWDTLKALVLARCTSFGIGLRRKRLAFIGVTDGHYAGVSLASDAPRLMVNYAHVSVNEPVAGMVERLNRFRPDDLRGYPSGLSILAAEQLAGRLDIAPRNIVSSAEPLDEKARTLVEEAFGVRPYNFYAASESIGIAQDCSEHAGLHVFNDQHVLELVDDKGEAVGYGKEGYVILTNLYNRCQPLIRYRMHDMAAYAEGECDCGLPYPLLKTVSGRREELLWVEDGRGGYEVIHPSVFVEFLVPGLRRLQVHQLERNRLLLKMVAEGSRDDIAAEVKRRMAEILSGKGLQDIVQFEVEQVDAIAPDSRTGKTRTVVSKMGTPHAL